MRIASSDITLNSRYGFLKKREAHESLRAWIGSQRPAFEGETPADAPAVKIDLISKPEEAATAQNTGERGSGYAALSPRDRMKVLLIESMIKALTGKDVKIAVPEMPDQSAADIPAPPQGTGASAPDKQGWGVEYSSRESYSEEEAVSFEAEGKVRTTDGMEFAFTARLALSRKFISENSLTLRAGDAKKIDPLGINFDGPAAQLTGTKFNFDLNADGKEEAMPFVGQGSGFLALDGNNDGTINSGAELFGPKTGNGFAELAAYDRDGNHWIDEADPVFSMLRIWTRTPEGGDSLAPLADKGIGAIYLGNTPAAFGFKDGRNELQAEMKNAGVFLNENGTAGTLQQIDIMA